MIFAIGGFVILIVSFAVALVSLIREQKVQGDLEKHVQDQPEENAVVSIKPDSVKQDLLLENAVVDSNPSPGLSQKAAGQEKTDEEIRSAKREEAYKILESRVNKMTESTNASDTTDRLSASQRSEALVSEEDPDTNIEDTVESDLVASEKVPFPWEEQNDEPANAQKQETPIQSIDKITPAPIHSRDWMPDETNKLSGQINVRDMNKDED